MIPAAPASAAFFDFSSKEISPLRTSAYFPETSIPSKSAADPMPGMTAYSAESPSSSSESKPLLISPTKREPSAASSAVWMENGFCADAIVSVCGILYGYPGMEYADGSEARSRQAHIYRNSRRRHRPGCPLPPDFPRFFVQTPAHPFSRYSITPSAPKLQLTTSTSR